MRACSVRLASVLLLASAAAAALGSAASAAESELVIGKQNYLRYCGSCHGPDGKGDGILSGTLNQKPADLTLIAKENGGKFPTAQVVSFIDGTKPVAAHGDREMPVWGEVLKEEAPGAAAQDRAVELKITSIVNYLKSIQQK